MNLRLKKVLRLPQHRTTLTDLKINELVDAVDALNKAVEEVAEEARKARRDARKK